MIKVKIGDSEKEYPDASPQWINEQIKRRREDGIPVCVQVLIDRSPLDFTLSTPGCSRGGGGGRPLNAQESSVVALWEKLHLNTLDFSGGNLVAFLKQIS